jgi:tetratricopeptide (TPR) repeat protein
LWFLGTLTPVIGFMQIGSQSMADRYTYLPQVGVLMAVVFSAWSLPRAWRLGLILLASVGVIGCWEQTRQQISHWRDTDALYARSLAVTRGNWFVHNNAARRARIKGDIRTEALHLRELERHGPRKSPVILGVLSDFQLRQGQFAEAARLLEEAVAVAPDAWPVVNNLAYLRAAAPVARLRDPPRALHLAQHMCDNVDPSSPEYPGYLDTLSAAQAAVGQFDDALQTATRALDRAIALNQPDLAALIVQHIKRYEARLTAE